jgi:threonine dehydrogenase-like Zn-dependent dehydrogenase
MRALYFDKSLFVKELPGPELIPGEAIIRTEYAGICATDKEIAAGYMNFTGVPGHEFTGIVSECEDFGWAGKRVVGEINAGCGKCEYCMRGMQRHCPNRSTLGIFRRDGVFAEYFSLPVENLLEIPADLSGEEAVFIEPLAAAMEILEQVKIEPGWKCAVIGDGKLAMLIAQALKLTGAELIVYGKDMGKLNLINSFGVNVSEGNPPENGFDVVVEASGNQTGFAEAVDCVRPRGIIVLKSTYAGGLNYNPAPVVVKEITIVGSRCGKFAPAMRMLAAGLIQVKPLISRVFPFEEITEAFEYARRPECLKVLVKFPS